MRRQETIPIPARMWDLDLPDKLRTLAAVPLPRALFALESEAWSISHQPSMRAAIAALAKDPSPYVSCSAVFTGWDTRRLEVYVWLYRRHAGAQKSHVVIAGEDKAAVARTKQSIESYLAAFTPSRSSQTVGPSSTVSPSMTELSEGGIPRRTVVDFLVQYGAALAVAATLALVGLLVARFR